MFKLRLYEYTVFERVCPQLLSVKLCLCVRLWLLSFRTVASERAGLSVTITKTMPV
jgi:hypothetical protein